MTGPQSKVLTPDGGAKLKDDGVQLAKQFRDKVLHPLLDAIDADQGVDQLLAFNTCLLLQCMANIRATHGDVHLQAVLTACSEAMQDAPGQLGTLKPYARAR